MNLLSANKAHASAVMAAGVAVWIGNAAAKALSGFAATGGFPMDGSTEGWFAGVLAAGVAWVATYFIPNVK